MNSLTVVGYVGRVDFRGPKDPAGAPMMKFSVADKIYQRGNRPEETIWWDCCIWGNKADNLSRIIRKGTYAAVVGSVRPNDYTDKHGVERKSWTLWVDQVEVKNPPRLDHNPKHDPSVVPFDQDDPDQGGGFDDDVPF